jgi:CelD/BcsL family acetyltransferase involved in cellulose biosynthesis
MTGLVANLTQRSGPGAITSCVVSDYQTFLALEADWNRAVSQARAPHPYPCLRHEWFRTWWDCFGIGRRLHIVTVRRGAQIMAIAPLMAEQTHMYGLPVRKLDLIHNDHTPRADFIIVGSDPSGYRAVWDALQAEHNRFDVLQMSRLPEDSPTRNAVSSLAHQTGYATGTWTGDASPYLTLSGTWSSYQHSLSAKFRSNVRNRLSRLRAFGEPRLEIIENPEEIARAREDALRLESSGWKEEARTSITSDPAVRRFYSLLAERAAAHGWLRLMFLTVAGRRIAASYASCFEGRLFLLKTGYDPAYASCSPFKILTCLAIERAFAEGLREIDFLGDAEPWKLEWTSTSRRHDWLYAFSNTARARLLHSLKFQVVPELKRWRA